MNIDDSIRPLGAVDLEPLKHAILALPEAAWLENQQRQQDYDVHQQTQSVVLVFCDGDTDDLRIEKREGWDYLAETALPLMHDIIQRHFEPGGTIIRAMAAKLLPAGRIKAHFDSHATFRHSHRIHLPVTTNSRVRFMIDGKPARMEIGQAYEINNQKTHSVMNSGKEARINFIFDYLPAGSIASRASA